MSCTSCTPMYPYPGVSLIRCRLCKVDTYFRDVPVVQLPKQGLQDPSPGVNPKASSESHQSWRINKRVPFMKPNMNPKKAEVVCSLCLQELSNKGPTSDHSCLIGSCMKSPRFESIAEGSIVEIGPVRTADPPWTSLKPHWLRRLFCLWKLFTIKTFVQWTNTGGKLCRAIRGFRPPRVRSQLKNYNPRRYTVYIPRSKTKLGSYNTSGTYT